MNGSHAHNEVQRATRHDRQTKKANQLNSKRDEILTTMSKTKEFLLPLSESETHCEKEQQQKNKEGEKIFTNREKKDEMCRFIDAWQRQANSIEFYKRQYVIRARV